MRTIVAVVGQRIRNYRKKKQISQEKLAELSGCHPTYIGQVERGEKNPTLESLEKISTALGISLSTLFENLGGGENPDENIPLACYDLLCSKTKQEQAALYRILCALDDYKKLLR